VVRLKAEATRGLGWRSGFGGAVVGRCGQAVAGTAVDVLVVRVVGEVRHGRFCVFVYVLVCLDESEKSDIKAHRRVYISSHICVYTMLFRTKVLPGRKRGTKEA